MRIFVSFSPLLLAIFLSPLSLASNSDLRSCELAVARTPHAFLTKEEPIAIIKMMENISRPDTLPGTVVAATTRAEPNYYFHWVRDAALVMSTLNKLYAQTNDLQLRPRIRGRLEEFAKLSRQHQMTMTKSMWQGEAKFEVGGRAIEEEWGRPQTDGPPLRAIALMEFGLQMLKEGNVDYVKSILYDGKIPTESVIKGDLEYTAHHWHTPSFDLWEEVKGDHFYNYMVSRKALLMGAEFAERMGDSAAAIFYRSEAKQIEKQILAKFVDKKRGIIIPTVNRIDGLDLKTQDIDIAVILGLLHGGMNDGFLPFTDLHVQITLMKLNDVFANLYPINKKGLVANLIGRYPEGQYANKFEGRNPWVLSTLAVAEAYYRMAQEYRELGDQVRAFAKLLQGDGFAARVGIHTGPEGILFEQIDRNTGAMTSVENLTWSYSALLTAAFARHDLEYKP